MSEEVKEVKVQKPIVTEFFVVRYFKYVDEERGFATGEVRVAAGVIKSCPQDVIGNIFRTAALGAREGCEKFVKSEVKKNKENAHHVQPKSETNDSGGNTKAIKGDGAPRTSSDGNPVHIESARSLGLVLGGDKK